MREDQQRSPVSIKQTTLLLFINYLPHQQDYIVILNNRPQQLQSLAESVRPVLILSCWCPFQGELYGWRTTLTKRKKHFAPAVERVQGDRFILLFFLHPLSEGWRAHASDSRRAESFSAVARRQRVLFTFSVRRKKVLDIKSPFAVSQRPSRAPLLTEITTSLQLSCLRLVPRFCFCWTLSDQQV